MATLALTLLFAWIVVISAVVGLIRGLNKSVIRLMTLVLAIILTFLIAAPVTRAIAQGVKIDGMTLGELIVGALREGDMVASLLDTMPLLQEMILVMPVFAISLVTFPVVFVILKFVTWIVFLCVQKPLRRAIFKDDGDAYDDKPAGLRVGLRFAGMGVGIISGVMIVGMLLTPTLGLFTILPEADNVDKMLDTMVEQKMVSADTAELVSQSYGVTDCTLVRTYNTLFVDKAGRAYLNSVSKVRLDGKTVCLTNELDALLNTVQMAFNDGALELMSAAKNPKDLYTFLSDRDRVEASMNSLFASSVMRDAIPEIMTLAMKSMAQSMHVPADKDAVYDAMLDKVAQAVRDSNFDSVATFSSRPQPLTNTISKILNDALAGDQKEFTDAVAGQIVSSVTADVAENGQDFLSDFDADSVLDTISKIDNETVDTDLLEQLTDREKFESDAATVESITQTIRASMKNTFADEETSAEAASVLADVVSNLAGAVSAATDENSQLDASKLDFEKIANAVTSLQNSSLKDVGSTVLDIVAGGDLGGNSMVSDTMGAVKEGYEKGEDIGGTIQSAGALINLGTAMNSEGNREEMVNSMTDLIENLNEFTISLLPNIISNDTLISAGVPAEYANAAYNVAETLMKELMKLQGTKNYDAEVDAILALYNVTMSNTTPLTEEKVTELVNSSLQSDAIYNTLISISDSNPFGIELKDTDARTNMINALEKQYDQSGKTPRELNAYRAVATLLGLENEVDLT